MRMSALGQKQTFQLHDLMSALPPKEDIRLERDDNRVRGADEGKGKLLSQVGDKN
jgi:hypothetical protein